MRKMLMSRHHACGCLFNTITNCCFYVVFHDDVIIWKHFPRYWPFVRGIHRSLVDYLSKPVTQSFHVFFDLRLNKRLREHSWPRWFETPSHSLWRHCYMLIFIPITSNHTSYEEVRYLLPLRCITVRWRINAETYLSFMIPHVSKFLIEEKYFEWKGKGTTNYVMLCSVLSVF